MVRCTDARRFSLDSKAVIPLYNTDSLTRRGVQIDGMTMAGDVIDQE